MLHVHRAERADGLVEALVGLLREPPPDPFAADVVAVPTRGMERWLTQRMSICLGASAGGTDGVCANVEFPSPRRLVADAVAAASGIDPEGDPWLVEHVMWPLLDTVEDCLAEPWLESLAGHLGAHDEERDESRRGRRLSTVRHVAELFDRYGLHRPEMVRAWARGEDGDGAGRALPGEALWQARLWRRLRERMGVESPAERLEDACARLRDEPALADLPSRLSLFGLTRLPAARLAALRALAAHRDVHLFLLHPSPVLWERVGAVRARLPGVVRRSEDPTATLASNGLLASWGQDARELQLVIGGDGGHVDHHHAVAHGGETLLARIQADARGDRAAPGAPLPGQDDARPLLDPGDRSVQVHACHGRGRQVEVARDAILHMLQDDPSLEPRDVIVMCPDIEAFAPLIHATFGVGAQLHDGDDDAPADGGLPDLRVRLADRALRQTNPVLGVVAQLLELTAARLTASQVLDLADREPVRRRFGFDDDDLARIGEWIADGGIRWGLDAAHRAPFKLESLAAGTWRVGLDRLLVGVTMTEEGHRLFEGVLAIDDVESGAIDLAGRLAELVDRLGAALDALSRPASMAGWAAAIAAAADALTATAPRDGWQRAGLQRLLDDLVEQARAGGRADAASLLPAEVRALFAERLRGRPTRANFRTGHLTICTLVPMRSVPHRVVCLLGLDDGAFPRKAHRDGDDLMLADAHAGDRDARTEDRQMLLDALLAANDRLIVTYTGNDERTNMPRPPAVPVGELLDVVDRTVRVDGGGDARARVVVRHPLQPFDPRNFEPGHVVPERPWSFDRVALDGARAIVGPRAGEEPFLRAPLADAAGPIVELDGLVRFAERPVRAFLRQRLGISVADYDEDVADALPVELDGLEVWAVGQRLVDGLLGGAQLDACVAAEIARGMLPPGALGAPVIERLRPTVQEIVAQAASLLGAAGDPGSVEVNALVGDGRFLRGTAPGVRGDVLARVTYSRVSPRHRLAAWVRLLALSASHPQRPFEAVTIGRARSGADDGARVTIARIPVLAADPAARRERALEALGRLIDVYDRGMREALPIACLTSAAYAQAARRGAGPAAAARAAWESTWNVDREDREPDHLLVLGGERTVEELLAVRPRPDEQGAGWEAGDETRFGRYARRMWGDLLACEEICDR